jgi:two-component system, chemotaxis family, protein-glutamate methylesterase/glutaminase
MRNPDQDHAASRNGPQDLMVVVLGTSAGGLRALKSLVGQLDPELPACYLAVYHLGPAGQVGHLVRALGKAGQLICREARDGDPLVAGTLYLAKADHHLLVDKDKVWVTRGPRENRWRPGIDPLFRSAAVHHNGSVIGVILTGTMDDGVVGLAAVRRCGGACVVQDPQASEYADLPARAMERVKGARAVRLDEMGAALESLIREGPREAVEVPRELLVEARAAAGDRITPETMDQIGQRTASTCPECGGVLWKLGDGSSVHFRCHTGHSFTAETLETDLSRRLEQTLWSAVRMFEERRLLLESMSPYGRQGSGLEDRVKESEAHSDLLRRLLTGREVMRQA